MSDIHLINSIRSRLDVMNSLIDNYVTNSTSDYLIDLAGLSEHINQIACDMSYLDSEEIEIIRGPFMSTYSKLQYLKQFLTDSLDETKSELNRVNDTKRAVSAYSRCANDN